MKKQETLNHINDNNGFTLVELIVCVAILALASVALLQSFSVAAITNGKAQRMQNATSLAESVMEEVKNSGIKQLQKEYNGAEDTEVLISQADDSASAISAAALGAVSGNSSAFLKGGTAQTPYYVLVKKGVTATQGEEYNVTATMRAKPYSEPEGDSASDANSIKLPVIEELDTHTKTVLTEKELNKYDFAATDYFYEHEGVAGTLSLASKEIVIDKTGNGNAGDTGEINVKCTVIYTADDGTTQYRKEVFKGTYISQYDKNGNRLPVDNDIYVFYNRFLWDSPGSESGTPGPETITVNDSSSNDKHRLYVIFQKDTKQTKVTTDDKDIENIAGTTITVTNGGDTKIGPISTNSAIEYDDDNDSETPKIKGRYKSDDKYWLITNLGVDEEGKIGVMSEKKRKNRVFEVTVDVTKEGDTQKYATITSTVNVME